MHRARAEILQAALRKEGYIFALAKRNEPMTTAARTRHLLYLLTSRLLLTLTLTLVPLLLHRNRERGTSIKSRGPITDNAYPFVVPTLFQRRYGGGGGEERRHYRAVHAAISTTKLWHDQVCHTIYTRTPKHA